MGLPTDRDSAEATLATVRELCGRLDLDHADADYMADKADRLAAYATSLLARGRGVHAHLLVEHQGQVPPRDALDLWNWLELHRRLHAPGASQPVVHTHPAGGPLTQGWQP